MKRNWCRLSWRQPSIYLGQVLPLESPGWALTFLGSTRPSWSNLQSASAAVVSTIEQSVACTILRAIECQELPESRRRWAMQRVNIAPDLWIHRHMSAKDVGAVRAPTIRRSHHANETDDADKDRF